MGESDGHRLGCVSVGDCNRRLRDIELSGDSGGDSLEFGLCVGIDWASARQRFDCVPLLVLGVAITPSKTTVRIVAGQVAGLNPTIVSNPKRVAQMPARKTATTTKSARSVLAIRTRRLRIGEGMYRDD